MYTSSETLIQPEETAVLPDGRSTRGQDRRELLLQTTLKLIAERGVGAVSHRAVAEAAGLPLGSTTYWFDSRQQMLTEALEYFVRDEIAALNDRLAGLRGADLSRPRMVEEFTTILMLQLGEDRWRTVAQYTLLQEAIRLPEVEAVCRDWNDAWDSALAGVFESLGVADPKLEAEMFLAMLDGILLSQLATPDPDVEQKLIRPALESWFSRLPSERNP